MDHQIQETIKQIHCTERYSDENREAWRQLFQLAKLQASRLKLQTRYQKYRQDIVVPRQADDILVRKIVDDWMAYDNTANITHSHPDNDRTANDMSCMQAIVHQKKQFMQEILEQLAITTCPTAREQLWHLYDQEVDTTLKATDYEAYAEFGDASEFYEYRDRTQHDESVSHHEYRDDTRLLTGIDPDDERYFGTPPKRDIDGVITFEARMQSDHFDRGRGAQGVLNGLYTNSYPEPNYYTKDQKRRLRSTLLESTNADDIKLATYMKPMSPARRMKLLRKRKDRLEELGHLPRGVKPRKFDQQLNREV